MKIHLSRCVFAMLFALLANLRAGVASEQILLDPKAKPAAPASTLAAVVAEAATSRSCALRLIPSGRVNVARPCALEERLQQVQRWLMTGGIITLENAEGRPLLRFNRIGSRAFRTADEGSGRLILTILPQSSIPLATP